MYALQVTVPSQPVFTMSKNYHYLLLANTSALIAQLKKSLVIS